jgi:hypothetical protein
MSQDLNQRLLVKFGKDLGWAFAIVTVSGAAA